MRDLEFRTATEADLDRVIVIHGTAFPDPRREPERRRNFLTNPLGTIDELWLAVRGETIVGHAFLFSLELFFGGRPVRASGIASVGVAPEARGTGVAGALLEHLHGVGRARGDAIAVLYPFRQAFYARHGYAPVTPSTRWSFAPEAVPSAWVDLQRRSERSAPKAGHTSLLEALYEEVARTECGWLRRPRALWDAKWLDERNHFVAIGPPNAPRGYAIFSYVQTEAHARTSIVIDELVARDAEARRALFGFFGAQRDQVSGVTIELAAGDPLGFALVDADRRGHGDAVVEHHLGVVCSGPMVRVLDLERALAARGYVQDAQVAIRLGERPFSLSSRAGSLSLTSASSTDVTIDEAAVPAILYGGLAPSVASSLGHATGTRAALAAADALFQLPPFSALDRF